MDKLEETQTRDTIDEDFDFSILNHPSSVYAPEQKIAAAMYWVTTGSFTQVSKYTGLSISTIQAWKDRANWWPELVASIRKQKQEELDSRLTGIINECTKEIEDRIENGDEVVDKNGALHRKKISAKELAIILGTLFDKRALIRGDPTSRTEKVTSDALLEQLKTKMEDFAKELQGRLITTEYKVLSNDNK